MLTVVIPCYREPDALRTLQSLVRCSRDDFSTKVIVVVNSYGIDSAATVELNRQTYNEISDFADNCKTGNFCIVPVLAENLSGHQTGAGIPRRIGMDLAVEHLNEDPRGVIVSLDADCTVSPNYLTEIERNFREYHLNSATIDFHHPVEHLPDDAPLRIATEQYEAYLHYFRSGLEFAGYPYPYYTIGSAFAVSVETYLKVGRMGRQQSGEDFYFLQKVFPLGRTRHIATATVYPEARPSDRVPFGTGPALSKMLASDSQVLLTYRAEAFLALKLFFDKVESFYGQSCVELCKNIIDLPQYLTQFLDRENFVVKIEEINRHTASKVSFHKRFFDWFNAFKIIKFMNFVHPERLSLSPVENEKKLIHLYKGD
jgi:glycosyltransferase involved in cell wall biosynthesis